MIVHCVVVTEVANTEMVILTEEQTGFSLSQGTGKLLSLPNPWFDVLVAFGHPTTQKGSGPDNEATG